MPFIRRAADKNGLIACGSRRGAQQRVEAAHRKRGSEMFLLDAGPVFIPAISDLRHAALQQVQADRFHREHGKCLIQDLFSSRFAEVETGFDPMGRMARPANASRNLQESPATARAAAGLFRCAAFHRGMATESDMRCADASSNGPVNSMPQHGFNLRNDLSLSGRQMGIPALVY